MELPLQYILLSGTADRIQLQSRGQISTSCQRLATSAIMHNLFWYKSRRCRFLHLRGTNLLHLKDAKTSNQTVKKFQRNSQPYHLEIFLGAIIGPTFLFFCILRFNSYTCITAL